ncbi:MAG: hypothetical protein U5L45_10120 [Saprospiraceae bacterium]|nr:hypothetical protein [Saprospiraceae bacterium]
MRNPIIRNAFLIIICFFSNKVLAQSHKTTLSLGRGQFFRKVFFEKTDPTTFGGNTSSEATTVFTPHIALRLERRSSRFSIGGGIDYLTSQSTKVNTQFFVGSTSPTQNQEDNDVKMRGISVNSKMFFYSDSDFDVYGGLGFGLLLTTTTRSFSSLVGGTRQITNTHSGSSDLNYLFQMNIGGRCFFTENIGVYGEVGYVALDSIQGIAGQAGIIYLF